jgi:DNA repair protein RecO (recombination protein O)
MFATRKMAEWRGFEPPIRCYPYNGLANRRLRPLGHHSARGNELAAIAREFNIFLYKAAGLCYNRLMISLTDNAIILTSRKHAETSALVEMLTGSHGVYKGIVKGAMGKNNRGLYQPGNLVSATWSARLAEHMGSIKAEMIKPYAALIMPHKNALTQLSSAATLLATALPERHSYPKIYDALQHLLAHLAYAPEECLAEYIRFELLLLAETGFGLDLSSCAATGIKEDLIYVSPKSGRAVSRDAGAPYHDKMLKNPALCSPQEGLATTYYFLEHWLYESLHRKIPAARRRLMHA